MKNFKSARVVLSLISTNNIGHICYRWNEAYAANLNCGVNKFIKKYHYYLSDVIEHDIFVCSTLPRGALGRFVLQQTHCMV